MGRGIGGMFVRRGVLVLFLGEGYTCVKETECWKMGKLVDGCIFNDLGTLQENAHNRREGVSVISTC